MWGPRLLIGAAIVVVAVIAAGVYRAWIWEGPWRFVATLDSLQPASVTYMEDESTFVVVEGDRVVALSAVDPHLEHKDLFCEQAQLFEGAHGEKFDKWGTYFAGPAPRGLDRVAHRVEGGNVEIDPTAVTEGPGRRDVRALEPEGPFCGDGTLGGRPGFFQEPSD
jgi:nitrite reductase/ring-hydroxylating ferredoxin subunit